MSIIINFLHNDKSFLMADGLAVDFQTTEHIDENYRKVFTLPNVEKQAIAISGFLYYAHEILSEYVENHKYVYCEDIYRAIVSIATNKIYNNEFNYNILITGVDMYGNYCTYIIRYHNGTYDFPNPLKNSNQTGLISYVLTPKDIDEPELKKVTDEIIKSYKKPHEILSDNTILKIMGDIIDVTASMNRYVNSNKMHIILD